MSSQPGVSKLSPELSELVVYTRSVPFKGFEQAAKNPATDMSSFSESEALRLIKDSGLLSTSNPTYCLKSFRAWMINCAVWRELN